MAAKKPTTKARPFVSISPSQLDAMSCRLAWYLGYRLGYKPNRSAIALEFGTGIHYALEMYYGKKQDPVKAFSKWADARMRELGDKIINFDEFMDHKNLGVIMLEGYLKRYEKEDFTVLATEKMIRRPLPSPTKDDPEVKCDLVARLDGLVRDNRTEKIFSLEHKTFERFSPGFMDRDHQMTAQVWLGQSLAESLGLEEGVAGVIYNGLRKQAPSPKVKNELYERLKVYRNDRQIEVFLHRAYHQYAEFNREGLAIYPQPNMVRCSQCDFGDVCRAYMLGEDWKFLLEQDYTTNSG